MFSFLGKESCKVQVYGKLPLAKDYLRVGAGSGSGQALRDWLDRAFSQGASAQDPLALPWPAALLVGEAWGQPLCAAAWPSGDAGHLRPFPFVAFVERKKKALLEDLERGFPVGSPVLDWLADAYAARESCSDGKSFLAAMRERELAIDALVPHPPERVDFDAWAGALWPDQGPDGLLECARALEALRRAAWRGPLRLPLVANLPSRPQVAAWHRLLVEMNLLGREALPTLCFPLPARGPAQPAPAAPAANGGDGEEGSGESGDSSGSDDSLLASDDSPLSSDDLGSDLASDAPTDDGGDLGASADPSGGSDGDSGPAFLLVFRSLPPPTDALWLRAPDARSARRQGDLCGPAAALAASTEPPPEGAPALGEALQRAFAGLRGKLAR